MAAPKGNQYYLLAKAWERDKSYVPDALWGKAVEYFQWVQSNPLIEEKAFGTGYTAKVSKIRAMTIRGFCVFANIATQTFQLYETKEEYSAITARIRDIIFTQKFEGAAAGLLETNIIARELGLIDRQDVTSRGETIRGPRVDASKLSEATLRELAAIQEEVKNE